MDNRSMSTTPLQAVHPLDPLGPDEISRAAMVARQELGLDDSARFVTITAVEPSKDALRGTDTPDRTAEIVVIDPERRRAWEVEVSLHAGVVTSQIELD